MTGRRPAPRAPRQRDDGAGGPGLEAAEPVLGRTCPYREPALRPAEFSRRVRTALASWTRSRSAHSPVLLQPARHCRQHLAAAAAGPGGLPGPGAARCPPAPRHCLLPRWRCDSRECVTARGSLSGAWVPFIRLCWRRPRLGHEQQVIGLPGGLGCAPSSWLSCGKVLQPVCQDTDRLSKRGDTALERVHAFLSRGRRFPGTPAGVLVHRAPPLAGDVCSGPKAGCPFVRISTAQPGPGGQGQMACCQAPVGHAAARWIGKPFSNPVTRSTSPVISTDRSYRNDGCRCSMMPKPASSSARRLVVGSSNGSPGMARRRRAQNSGWISTGRFARPGWPMRPDSPVVWSKRP